MWVCAYGICRNEEKFIEGWLSQAAEADCIVLLDTGSQDHTLALAADWAARQGFDSLHLADRVGDFRFDQARNQALALAEDCGKEADSRRVFISLDLDERIAPGWREKLENPTEQARGLRLTVDNGGYRFPSLRIHSPGWHWVHACHEVLTGPGPVADVPLTIVHQPDRDKPRLDYLPLLQLDARERPKDGRAWHYLGREYYYRDLWLDAITALVRSLKYDGWHEQRAGAMRFLNRCCWQLGRWTEAEYWARAAVREYASAGACTDLAWLLRQIGDEEAAIWETEAATLGTGSYPFG